MKKEWLIGAVCFVVGAVAGIGGTRLAYRDTTNVASSDSMESGSDESKLASVQGVSDAEISKARDPEETEIKKAGPAMPEPERPNASSSLGTLGTLLLNGKNEILVNDQAPGKKVAITTVTLSGTGWVVIHEEMNGKPGTILGAQRFNAGTYANGSVDLLKETREGRVYYAMIHADNGDKQFSYITDLPVKDQIGNPVLQRFVVTVKPTEQ